MAGPTPEHQLNRLGLLRGATHIVRVYATRNCSGCSRMLQDAKGDQDAGRTGCRVPRVPRHRVPMEVKMRRVPMDAECPRMLKDTHGCCCSCASCTGT